MLKTGLAVAVVSMAAPALAQSNKVVVSNSISVSTTWRANKFYELTKQIYVCAGATLTIEAGTVLVSSGGSLAVVRGAKIFVQGTRDRPVIMTSKQDVATWTALASHPTGKNPKTGMWRERANEWGNLTVLGSGYISANTAGNSPTPRPANVAPMDGLAPSFPGDPKVLYGGGNDNDDSGAIQFLSLRYCGRVVGLANQLNGLSLGGVGRGTDIHHVEVMNNVDDGIQIFGGTVNLRYVSVCFANRIGKLSRDEDASTSREVAAKALPGANEVFPR